MDGPPPYLIAASSVMRSHIGCIRPRSSRQSSLGIEREIHFMIIIRSLTEDGWDRQQDQAQAHDNRWAMVMAPIQPLSNH